MSTLTFHPARLHGSALIPPAKSEAHRALLLAALGQGPCRLPGFQPPLCDDTQAMVNGITALGAQVAQEADSLVVLPAPSPMKDAAQVHFHVYACAAALRMLIPVFLARGQAVRITMEEALSRRPQDAFAPLIQRLDAEMTLSPSKDGQPATLLLTGRMPAGDYEMDGTLSSQFSSGMLIALSHAATLAGAPSTLQVTRPIASRPYLDMTLLQMRQFDAPCVETDEGMFTLSPREKPNPKDYAVAGDWSQAAVLLCANAMGSAVQLRNLCAPKAEEPCLQGDSEILSVLRSMGLCVRKLKGELDVRCPSRARLLPMHQDCTGIPDLAPILALTCTQAWGCSVLTGVRRLRVKECDRLCATVELLTQLGARAEASEDGDTLTVHGPAALRGGFTADARSDHRIVMFLAAAALIADGPITVTGVEALDKSWPAFVQTYEALGGVIS